MKSGAWRVSYLLHDPVDLAVLGVDLVAHVQCHVAQVTDDAAHLLQVLVHLIFPGIVCYPEHTHTHTKTGGRFKYCDIYMNTRPHTPHIAALTRFRKVLKTLSSIFHLWSFSCLLRAVFDLGRGIWTLGGSSAQQFIFYCTAVIL